MGEPRQCVCGHTAHWHSHRGTGECEFDRICGCKAFERAPAVEPVEPLIIGICPECGQPTTEETCPHHDGSNRPVPTRVRVFREEEVRSLWQHLWDISRGCITPQVHALSGLRLISFEPPEEWSR